MKQFTRYLPSGETVCGYCQDNQFELQAKDGDILFEGYFPADRYYLVNGFPVEKPTQPSSNYDWDTTSHIWTQNIDRAKKQKKIAIETRREQLIYDNILYDGHIFQADEYSIKNIQKKLNEIAAAETLNVPVSPMFWRDFENNNYYWNDLPTYKLWLNGFIVTIATRTTSIIVSSFLHKDAITALNSVEDIESYDITINWSN